MNFNHNGIYSLNGILTGFDGEFNGLDLVILAIHLSMAWHPIHQPKDFLGKIYRKSVFFHIPDGSSEVVTEAVVKTPKTW